MDEPTRQAVLKLFRDTIARVEAENKTALANTEAFFKSIPLAKPLCGGCASSPQRGMRYTVIYRLKRSKWYTDRAPEDSRPDLEAMGDLELLDLYGKFGKE